MRNFVQLKDGLVVSYGQVRNDAKQDSSKIEVINVTGSLMGATYDEQNGHFTNSDGDIIAHVK